jgi:hypothetical protein
MSAIVFEDSFDPSSENFQEYLTAQKLRNIFMVIEGTTDTGQTFDPADMGNVQVVRNGDELMNVPFELLHKIQNEWGGVLESTTPQAGATRYVSAVPMWFPEGLSNVLEIESNKELRLLIKPDQSAISTAFGSNDVEVRIFTEAYPDASEAYELRAYQETYSFGGANETEQDTYNERDIVRTFFEDPSDVVSTLFCERDQRTLVDTVQLEEVNDVQNLINRVESGPDSVVEVNPLEGRGFGAVQSSTFRFRAQSSGSGNLLVTRMRLTNIRA